MRLQKLVRLGRALAVIAVAGCSTTSSDSIEDVANRDIVEAVTACCAAEDKYSVEMVNLATSAADIVVPFARSIVLRKAYLQGVSEVEDLILGQARPLDLILIENRARLTGVTGAGYFGHVAIYIGNEADLRAMGLWDNPVIAKHHDQIRAGAIAIEAVDTDVHLSDPNRLMEADSAALFRTTGISPARQKQAIIQLFQELGKPFDNRFDLETPDEIYCTELIHDAMPELNLPVSISYGRRAIWPDEIATQSLIGKNALEFVTYVYGTPSGWQEQSASVMVARILRGWPDSGL